MQVGKGPMGKLESEIMQFFYVYHILRVINKWLSEAIGYINTHQLS